MAAVLLMRHDAELTQSRRSKRYAQGLFADDLKCVLPVEGGDSLSNPMTEPYLAKLNPEQRRAVEHSVANAEPLLIIAGAGTGKTNTLAHRVAHLILQNVDPGRIMLLTFSRRAAVEMTRRVQRIASQVLPAARLMADGLT